MNLFLGNLSWEATEEELRRHFEGFGPIKSVKIMTDRESGKPRGFAFMEFENRADGDRARGATDGQAFMGRPLTVNEAKPKESRPHAGGGKERFQQRDNRERSNRNEW